MQTPRKNAFINFFARIRYFFARSLKATSVTLQLNPRNWRWISRGAGISLLLFIFGFLIFLAPSLTFPWLIVSMLILIAAPLFIGLVSTLGLALIEGVDRRARIMVFSAIAMVYMFFSAPAGGRIVQQLFVVASFLFVAGALSNLTANQWTGLSNAKRILTLSFLFLGSAGMIAMAWFFIHRGPASDEDCSKAMTGSFLPDTLQLIDPALDGPYEVMYFTYGAGTDKHRKEFADGAELISQVVDGSAFIDGWSGFRGNARTFFWGFGPDSLPLNGRVWMPDAQGPFPLILMVHGNHLDRDYSDEGYAYVGKHMASLGCIAVSVDENFLNGSLTNMGQNFTGENDARGWLLLKHIEQLERWTRSDSTLFSGKIDLDNIVLIGHSRGGEAVNVAACFNILPYYPDNALERFDFNFGIRGIVAIAPVDGQYKPSLVPTPIRNINYLTLQGSMDADMNSYHGMRPFNRLVFDDSLPHFKAGVFIHGANHGQFNTTWGWNDIGYPGGLLLNRRGMMPPADQRQIATVYLSAFMMTTFGMEPGYMELFRDYRAARHWLPEAVIRNQYMDSKTDYRVTYEEDLDLTTASDGQLAIAFTDLSKVKEQEIQLRWSGTENKAVILGWNNSGDSIPGTYVLLADSLRLLDLSSYDRLVMSVAAMDEDPGDRPGKEDEEQPEGENEQEDDAPGDEQEEADESPDFTVMMVDASGDSASINVASVCPLYPPIKPRVYKLNLFAFDPIAETVPQYVYLPLEHFTGMEPDFSRDSVASVHFIFDRTEKGVVMIDDIGFTAHHHDRHGDR
jgi:hypothetical protein